MRAFVKQKAREIRFFFIRGQWISLSPHSPFVRSNIVVKTSRTQHAQCKLSTSVRDDAKVQASVTSVSCLAVLRTEGSRRLRCTHTHRPRFTVNDAYPSRVCRRADALFHIMYFVNSVESPSTNLHSTDPILSNLT